MLHFIGGEALQYADTLSRNPAKFLNNSISELILYQERQASLMNGSWRRILNKVILKIHFSFQLNGQL